jgi:hypothetical protein
MTEELFSVYQFFPDDFNERIAHGVPIKEAMFIAADYARRPAAKLGVIKKVMITDGGDFCVFLWENGIGVTWPTPAEGLNPELYRREEKK